MNVVSSHRIDFLNTSFVRHHVIQGGYSYFRISLRVAQKHNNQWVQSLSHVWLFVTPWTAACQALLSLTISQGLLKLMSITSVMPSNHLILCHSLLLPPSIFPSIRVFSNESSLCNRWPKHCSFSFSISPSMNTQDWSPLDGLVGSPCSLRDYQESSPTPQFKSIKSISELISVLVQNRNNFIVDR